MGREGREVGSLKRRVRSQCGQRRNEKWHAAVARSAFAIQNLGQLMASGHFWKFGCGKMARLCGEAHLQVNMHNIPNIPRPLLGVTMFKKWHRRCGAGGIICMKASGRFFGSCRCRSCGKRQTGAKVHLQVNMYETPAVSGR